MSYERTDYTKMRKGQHTEKGRVAVCPKCGRKGIVHRYTNGTALTIHTGHVDYGLFFNIDDSCMFRTAVTD